MKLHEKIKKIRLEKGMLLKEMHRRMLYVFGKNAVTYRTLLRVEAGDTIARERTFYQICMALGIPSSELKKDTEEENQPADFIRKHKRLDMYLYNGKAYAKLLLRRNRNFMVMELILEPAGSTTVEYDPELKMDENTIEKIKELSKNLNPQASVLKDYKIFKFEKYVYCLKGTITCYIGNDKYIIKAGDGITFASSNHHRFENNSKSRTRCLIFQNPCFFPQSRLF